MTKNSLFLLLSLILITFGCTKIDFNLKTENISSKVSNSQSAKFNISLKTVESYLKIKNAKSSDISVSEIIPITKGLDTLLYIVNYQNNRGWVVISGDKRTRPELSFSKDGDFYSCENNPGISIWLNDVAESIYSLKHSINSDTTSKTYQLWTNIENLGKFVKLKDISNITKGGGEEEEGYWSLVFIESTDLPSYTKGPLLSTKWGQYEPWDYCVPTHFGNTLKCETGCVAVAGAQMSYYLHYKIGRPLMTYSNGSCTGWSQRDSVHDFTFNFSDFDTTAWAQMALINPCIDGYQVGEQKVGILMAYIGSRVHMDYGYGSSAKTDSLVDFFAENGVSCEMANYNASTVRSQLMNNMPVILRAYSERYYANYLHRIEGIFSYKTGHTWVADGYEDTKVHYKYYYQWFAKDDPLPEVDLLDIEHIRTEEFDFVTNTYLIMNWGYDGWWDNSRYSFDIDAYWDSNLEGHQFLKEMIYNFSIQ